MFSFFYTLSLIFLFVPGIWKLGSICSQKLFRFPHQAQIIALETGMGLLVLSHFIFLLSVLRLASKPTHIVIWGLLSLLGLRVLLLRLLPWSKKNLHFYIPQSKLGKTWLLLGTLYVLWMFACITLPASSRDELLYHLDIPKRMLQVGGWSWFQDNVCAYYPGLQEMLLFHGYALNGEIGARFFHLISGALLVLALYGFSRNSLGRMSSWFAVSCFLSVPTIMVILPWAYVDLSFALYAFLALSALLQFIKKPQTSLLFTAGLMIGSAAAVKYTGFQLLLLLLVMLGISHLFKKKNNWIQIILILGSLTLLIPLPYLIRNWISTGWPLFPFAYGPFTLNPSINWDLSRARLYVSYLAALGTEIKGTNPLETLLAPLFVFLFAEFDNPRRYDGMIGPAFLLIPLFFKSLIKKHQVKILSIFCIVFLYYWSVTTKQARFLIPLLPPLSYLLAYLLQQNKSRKWLLVLSALFILANVGFGTWQVLKQHPHAYWLGKENRNIYLNKRVSVHRIYQKANEILKKGERLYLLQMKNYGYYLDCDWRSDYIFQSYRVEVLLRNKENTNQLLAEFFKKQGITHILLDIDFIKYNSFGFEPSMVKKLKLFLDEYTQPVTKDRGYLLLRFAYDSLG